nr:reverse transcriptase domain-containing protein [Tanacetum cinerariifolium]
MPFGLKNAGATYQRLMDKAFESQVGRNIEVYVDDLVVKNHTEDEMVRDIEETFRTLRKVNMKLNPKNCSFGLAEGVFLGYVITPEGIKPCPDKTEAIRQLPTPRTVKEVQSLNGKLANLNRFLSKSAEKPLPLFQTLKKCIKKSKFRWTAEAEQAFQQLKQHFSELPLLVAPKPQEELIMYLSATYRALVEYLKEGVLPGDKKQARKLRLKARQYELMEGVLYRRLFLTAWLRCVGPLQADYVMREIHEGSYSMHAGLRANRSLGEGIKARLGKGNKNWVEELPNVLWARRTMNKSSHSDTPFSLTYETEAVIPAEIGMPTYRTAVVDVVNNDEELRLNLDLLEERRERAVVCEARVKSKMMKYYNTRVRGVTFKQEDFVYRSNDASHAIAGGKLGPKWEVPYEVTEALGNGGYKLRSTDGTVLPRTWNVTNLKRCYL